LIALIGFIASMQAWFDRFPIAAGLAFVFCLWAGILYFLSILSGWRILAHKNRSRETASGPKWRFQSGKLGVFRFRSSLTVGANKDGLYLAVFFLFRFGHPPLFIPWEETSVPRISGLFVPSIGFQLEKDQVCLLRPLQSSLSR
jgi:hypothetical protein